MSVSRYFGSKAAAKPHLLQGSGGLSHEIVDLRQDVEAAFLTQQTEQGGTTAQRPATPYTGQRYFDTTLGYEITWNGAAWVASSSALGAVKRTLTLPFAMMSGLGAGVKTYTLADAGGALPANARILGFSISALTGFDDATHGNFDLEVGVAAVNDVMASTSIKAGSAAAPRAGTAAAKGYVGAPAVGTPSLKLTGSVDLNTLTAGSVSVELIYFVLP